MESFDRMSHGWLQTHIPTDKVILHQWLKAGYLEKGACVATTDETPQGGMIAPAGEGAAGWTGNVGATLFGYDRTATLPE